MQIGLLFCRFSIHLLSVIATELLCISMIPVVLRSKFCVSCKFYANKEKIQYICIFCKNRKILNRGPIANQPLLKGYPSIEN